MTFGRFQVHETLGKVASGEVFLAFDPQRSGEVALKVLAADDPSPQQLERFVREGEIASRLDHRGIVRVLSAGWVGSRPYLAYERVKECRTLGEAAPALTL